MSRTDLSRLADVVEAIGAIQGHLARGGLDDELVYDAVRMRIIEIGEAVDGISAELLATAPDVPWAAMARMRDHLARRDFDADRSIVRDVVTDQLGPLLHAVRSLLERMDRPAGESSPAVG